MIVDWKTFDAPPPKNTHILVVFYWPNGEDYNMCLYYWMGAWDADFMESCDWGVGTYPVRWTERPEYPELPEVHG